MKRLLALAAIALALPACASQQGMPEVGPPRRGVALGSAIMREYGTCHTQRSSICSLEEKDDGTWEVIAYPYGATITIPTYDPTRPAPAPITLPAPEVRPTLPAGGPEAPVDAARTYYAGPAEDSEATLEALSDCEDDGFKVCDYHDGVVEGIR